MPKNGMNGSGELADKPQRGRPVKNTMPSRHQASKAELDEPIHLPGRSPEDVAQVVMQGGGVVTLLNDRAANWHRTQTQAAAVAVCHRPVAWLRNWRNAFRDIRWRWTLKGCCHINRVADPAE